MLEIGIDVLKCTALIPFHPLEVSIWEVAQRVQSAAKWNTPAGRGSLRMLVVGVKSGMEVKVFLNVDEVYVVLCEQLTHACGVGRLVARNIVAVQDIW